MHIFVAERRGSDNIRVIKRSKREQRRSILEWGWQKKIIEAFKIGGGGGVILIFDIEGERERQR